MPMIRISGRNSAIPPGCACAARPRFAEAKIEMVTIIMPFPLAPAKRLPRVTPRSPANRLTRATPPGRTTCRGRQAGNSFAEDAAPPCDRAQHPLGFVLFQTSLKVKAELIELPKTDSLANFAHYVKVKVDVVVGVQNDRQEFSARR